MMMLNSSSYMGLIICIYSSCLRAFVRKHESHPLPPFGGQEPLLVGRTRTKHLLYLVVEVGVILGAGAGMRDPSARC
jgi:hypothetical protein